MSRLAFNSKIDWNDAPSLQKGNLRGAHVQSTGLKLRVISGGSCLDLLACTTKATGGWEVGGGGGGSTPSLQTSSLYLKGLVLFKLHFHLPLFSHKW